MRRDRQPVEEPLQGVAQEDVAGIRAARAGSGEKPMMHGRGDVRDLPFAHASASMYGRMTDPVRHACARSHSSAGELLRCSRQSRSASTATSMPTRLR